MLKLCKTCGLEKPYDPDGGKNRKASGFHRRKCWECHLLTQQKARSTEEGRAYATAASVKCHAERRKRDAWFRLRLALAGETNRLLKNLAVGKGTDYMCLKLFGTDRATALAHFERQLLARGWTWADYLTGGIEADHRVPLGLAQSSNELRTLALLENVQLLSKAENAIKAIADRELIQRHEQPLTY